MSIPKAEINLNNLVSLVSNNGYFLTHYRSVRCPCIDPTTGSPDPNHTVCDHGWQYFGEETIQGLISGISSERQYAESGGFWLGAMTLTVLPGVRLSFHDRIINQQSVMVYTELLTVDDTNGTKLRYSPVDIDYVVDINGTSYTQGEDFTLNGQALAWVSGHGPANGGQFSVAYLCNPVWLVISHPHVIRDTQTKYQMLNQQNLALPLQAQCKLEWLVEG